MASAKVNSVRDFFQSVANGFVNDLRDTLNKAGFEKTTQLARSYNEIGETPLLVAIGKQHFLVMKFLVDVLNVDIGQTGRFISNRVDCADCPPLFAAVVSLQTVFIGFLIYRSVARSKPLLDSASFLSSSITCRHKINVLELMGATYLLSEYLRLRSDGLSCWMEAMTLASSAAEIRPSRIRRHSSIPAFQFAGSTSEVMTFEQLKRMADGELEFDQRLVKERAFRVSRRVLSEMQLYPDIFIISHYLMVMSPDLGQLEYFTRDELQYLSSAATCTFQLLKLWWEKEKLNPCTEMQTWPYMRRAILLSLELFEDLRLFVPDYVLPFSDLMFTLDFACDHLHRMYTNFWPSEENHRSREIGHVTRLVRNMAVFIFRALPLFSDQERQQFKQCLSHYVRLYRGWDVDRPNLLHEACCLSYVFKQNEADYDKVVQLFLDAGEDPNATDSRGNTPLHLLLAKNECEYCLDRWGVLDEEEHVSIVSLNYMAVIKLVLDSGCHVDQTNEGGETVLGLLKCNRRIGINLDKSFDLYLRSVINAVLPLTCYSAQSIRKHNISTGKLPPTLQLFVRRH